MKSQSIPALAWRAFYLVTRNAWRRLSRPKRVGVVAVVAAALLRLVAAIVGHRYDRYIGRAEELVGLGNGYWTVPAWVVDPSNASGCASDSNTCTQSTCGGVGSNQGPCLTWGQVVSRWGTRAPTIAQNTTITFLSSQLDPSDPVMWDAVIASTPAGVTPSLSIVGVPTTVATGTAFTLVAARNHATNTELQGSFASSAVAVNTMLVNTTSGKSSVAWPIRKVGSTWHISQPIPPLTVPNTNGSPILVSPEVNTWATSDTIDVKTLPKVWITRLHPVNSGNGGAGFIQVFHVDVAEGTGVTDGLDRIDMGDYSALGECAVDRMLAANSIVSSAQTDYVLEYANVAANGGAALAGNPVSINGAASLLVVFGGYIANQSGTISPIAFSGVSLDFDVVLRGLSTPNSITFEGYSMLGAVEFNTNATLQSGVIDNISITETGTNALWGSGQLDIANGQLLYTGGASGCANTIPLAGGLRMAGQTLGCLVIASSSTITCNKTINCTDLDTDLGTIGGSYTVLGRAAISNLGL